MSSSSVINREWTESQKRGITTVDTNLLVSAAAGSGKTTVLAERCVHLICDTADPCATGELLVVTFTDAAAAEMKSRIATALARRYEQNPSPRIYHQLALIDRAAIGTLHGFCARVLRQHFHRVELDPNFVQLDGDEVSLLKAEVARALLEARYEEETDDAFRTFVDAYGNGEDEKLVELITAAHDTIGSMLDPGLWAESARQRLADAAHQPLTKSMLGQAYIQTIETALLTLRDDFRTTIALLKRLTQFDGYIAKLNDHVAAVQEWIDILQQHGPDKLYDAVQSYDPGRMPPVKKDVPNKDAAKKLVDDVNDELKKGSWRTYLRFSEADWHDGLLRILPHVEMFLRLVEQFKDLYTAEKRRQNALDFTDLELLALRVLRGDGPGVAPSDIARGYHRQFRHVLVDEYQDINQVQDAILCLVSRECLCGDKPPAPGVANLFCVGDVKQSIYRFRLAEPAQFLKRRDAYQASASRGQVIDLQENFRSRTPLLNAINALFERMMSRAAVDLEYDQSQWLHGRRQFPDPGDGDFTGSPIELHLVPEADEFKDEGGDTTDDDDTAAADRIEREADVLAGRILQLIGSGTNVTDRATHTRRPVRYGDVVILLRAMKFKADQFAERFRRAGIPVHSESSTGYFQATEINDLLSLLHLLDNRAQDIPLAAVLRSPLLGLAEADAQLATLRVAYPYRPAAAADDNDTDVKAPRVAFHEAVLRYTNEKHDTLAVALREFFARLDRWRDIARQRPVAELVWQILQETGYLAYVSGLDNSAQRQANVLELYDRAGQFGTFRRQGLGRFLEFLEKLKLESDLGQASIASPADNVVRIMSVHRSKGLEFPIVCVPDLGKGFNLSDCKGTVLLDRELGIALDVVDVDRLVKYPSLASVVAVDRLRQQTLAEEMRVLYVAMTRAEEHLILVGTCSAKKAEQWTQRYTGHLGALPRQDVLGASSLLDWLGSAAAATATDPVAPVQITRHDQVAAPAARASTTNCQDTGRLELLARLQPIAPAPPADAQADAVIDRLTRRYAHESLDAVPATQSVTAITHANDARRNPFKANDKQAASGEPDVLVESDEGQDIFESTDRAGPGVIATSTADVSSPEQIALDRALPLPTFLHAEAVALSAADRGSATHLVLEWLDFAHADAADDIRRQVDHFLAAGRLTSPEADAVDIDAIDWFCHSDVGTIVRQNADKLRREVPLYFAHVPDGLAGTKLDAMDHIMVRGRIDLLVPDGNGWMIVDYKTDRVNGDSLDRRAADYATQLDLYRKAMTHVLCAPPTRGVLVFLHPRQLRTTFGR